MQTPALQDKLITAQEAALEAAKQTAVLAAAEADRAQLQARCEALEADLTEARRPWWRKVFR